jgi:hypothetical protein
METNLIVEAKCNFQKSFHKAFQEIFSKSKSSNIVLFFQITLCLCLLREA